MSDLINARMTALLTEAAQCFAEHRSPFTAEWLRAHDVTLDESIQLADLISLILTGFADGTRETQQRVVESGVTT